jgi:DNA-binding transcriptional MerR regulator
VTIDLRGPAGPARTTPDGSFVPAVRALLDLGMSPDEIDEILEADDPRLVHRHLELQRERLNERLADQLATLAAVDALLTRR